jgi:hypothetical protein
MDHSFSTFESHYRAFSFITFHKWSEANRKTNCLGNNKPTLAIIQPILAIKLSSKTTQNKITEIASKAILQICFQDTLQTFKQIDAADFHIRFLNLDKELVQIEVAKILFRYQYVTKN